MRRLFAFGCLLGVAALATGPAGAIQRAKPEPGDPKKVKPALLLGLFFSGEEGGSVWDGSKYGQRRAKLVKGQVVDGPEFRVEDPITYMLPVGTLLKAKAVEFKGDGHIACKTPEWRDWAVDSPLVVGAWVYPGSGNGVVAAMGGKDNGFSLYLKDGVPTFAVRSAGKLTVAKAEKKVQLRRWVSLVGVLDASGRLRVWVDGKPAGAAVEVSHLRKQPAAGMSVGADTGSLVGDYKDAQHWKGKLTSVRLYCGVPDEKELKKWARVP
jgi:hypothetical protein